MGESVSTTEHQPWIVPRRPCPFVCDGRFTFHSFKMDAWIETPTSAECALAMALERDPDTTRYEFVAHGVFEATLAEREVFVMLIPRDGPRRDKVLGRIEAMRGRPIPNVGVEERAIRAESIGPLRELID